MRASLTAKKDLSLIYMLVFFGGLLLFVGLRQLTSPWKYLSLAGFLLSAVVIVAEVKTWQDLERLFDLKGCRAMVIITWS
jgi:hypothetical protein